MTVRLPALCACLLGAALMSLSCDGLDDRHHPADGWTNTGPVVATTAEGAFVGIGTKSPSSPFSVFHDGIPVAANAFAVAAFDPKEPDKGVWLGYDASSVTGVVGADSDGKGASELAFWTHDATSHGERMRLTANGNLGVGVAWPGEKLHVAGNVRVQGKSDCIVGLGAGGISCSTETDPVPSVRTIAGALAKILSLRGVEFDDIENPLTPAQPGIGLIAREVEGVFPSAVTTDAQGVKRMDYAVLVAPLIGAVQEMNAEISELKKQNASLIQWICTKDPTVPLCSEAKRK